MKTADFIPLILLELNGGNKYGLEITKAIEKRSSGKIVIKQPTLYAILKKLEKSKFISSYWLDSEIGGKRHYYKITENGKAQAATFPNYNEVIRRIIEAEENKNYKPQTNNINPYAENYRRYSQPRKMDEVEQLSILDALAGVNNNLETATVVEEKQEVKEETKENSEIEQPIIEPLETILPTNEVFELDSIDNLTTSELNQQNSKMLKASKDEQEEIFASNTQVQQFTKKPESIITEEYKEQLKSIYENTKKKFEENDAVINNEDFNSIKYVDFVDFKNNKAYLKGKKTAKAVGANILLTSLYLLVALILTSFAVRFSTDLTAYYIALTIGILGLLIYPALFMLNYEKLRLKWEEENYKLRTIKKLTIAFVIFVLVIVLFILLNITIIKLNLKEIFRLNNFANFYTPIILATTVFADVIFNKIYLSKAK